MCLQYVVAPGVWFNVLFSDVPIREIPFDDRKGLSQRMFDLDFVAWLAFQD